MIFVYILETVSDPKHHYTGITNDLDMRLKQHNAGQVDYSSRHRPWIYKNYFAFKDEKKAYDFEKYLKSGSGRAFSKRHF